MFTFVGVFMQLRLWIKPIPIPALVGLLLVIWLSYVSLPMTYQRVKMLINAPFIWGAVCFIVLYMIRFRKSANFHFLKTKDHELMHTFFVLILFKNMEEFVATSHQGGHIRYSSRMQFGDTIIGLAPYVIRIPFVLSALVCSWVLSLKFNQWAYFLIGFTFAYSYLAILSEAHWQQTDLQETNLIHSYLSIIASHILMLGFVSSLVLPHTSVTFFLKTIINKALFISIL